MRLRVRLPIGLYLSGSNCENLACSTAFRHREGTVTLALEQWQAFEDPELSPLKKYFRVTKSILLTIDDANSAAKIIDLLSPQKHSELLQQLAKLVNRVIRVFRSFGLVTSLAEMHSVELGDVDHLLLSWQVEHDDVAETGSWRAIVKFDAQSEGSATKGADVSLPSNFLESGRWPEIEEALQGNREPPPEREFGANCIQHLSAYNYRAAVLESIIGLEIVLADYLREVLPSKGLTKEEVGNALGATITLNFRLSVLLRLVFSDSDLKNANLQEALKVVNWRNYIIHRRGNLPQGLPEGDIKTAVKAVLSLIQLLALRRDELRASPAHRKLADDIARRFGVPRPTFWYGLHHYRVAFFTVAALPPQRELEEIVLHLCATLGEMDDFFRAEQHLSVIFRGLFGNILAKWCDGQWSDATVRAKI